MTKKYYAGGGIPIGDGWVKLPKEIITKCPGCKAFETLDFDSEGLVPTRKYKQKGRSIYHDCGTILPCVLFPVIHRIEVQSDTMVSPVDWAGLTIRE